MTRTQEKSLFLHWQKEAWDYVITEVEARHHAKEVENMVSDLSERACKDGEDAAQAVRERDELHRWDVESRQ
jgi:predicted Fe-Mo cluster-binding NifX family protein